MENSAIRELVINHLPGATVEVSGDGRHFDVLVISEAFAGLLPVKKQQLVYGALTEQIANGNLHAVNIKAYTPEQWATLQAKQAG
jgi:acid stress-induced BolA-like protein IbaG/YrbA